jgi:hypothetical protein
LHFLIKSQENTIYSNDSEDDPIKPRVQSNQVDDLVSERISNGHAAQRDRGVVLGAIDHLFVVSIWVWWKRLLQCLPVLDAEVSKSELGNLLNSKLIFSFYLK